MIDGVESIVEVLGRLLLGILRLALWLSWETGLGWLCEILGWLGWRGLTFGNWPGGSAGEVDQLRGLDYFLVVLLGGGILVGLIVAVWWLT